MSRWLLLMLSAAIATPALAVEIEYTFLTHPSLIGKSPGNDGLWGTTDDMDVPGFNTKGAATADLNADGSFAYLGGGTTFDLDTTTGAYNFVSVTALSEFTVPGVFTNFNATGTLSPTGVNKGTVNFLSQTFAHKYDTSFPAFSAIVRTSSVGTFVSNGQNPADVISDAGLLAHVSFLIPLLPTNWQFLLVSLDTYDVLDSATLALRISGVGSSADFSVAPVPLPAALPLFTLALGGLAAVKRARLVAG
jgi:hypothetical protein